MMNFKKLVQGLGSEIGSFIHGGSDPSGFQPGAPQMGQQGQPIQSSQRSAFTNNQQTLNPDSNPFDVGLQHAMMNAIHTPKFNTELQTVAKQPFQSSQRAAFTSQRSTFNPISNQLDVGLQHAVLPQVYPKPLPGYEQQAAIYNDNPRDPRVARMDPKYFGYPADELPQPMQHQNPLQFLKRLIGF